MLKTIPSSDVRGRRALVAQVRGQLDRAGVAAEVKLELGGDDEPQPRVSVLTETPYAAWRALTDTRDVWMEEREPASIVERIGGIQFVIGRGTV